MSKIKKDKKKSDLLLPKTSIPSVANNSGGPEDGFLDPHKDMFLEV
jgi:hypothetical protein